MIDFTNDIFIKLSKTWNDKLIEKVKPLLLEKENVIDMYKALRDHVIFTDLRVIAVNVKGVSGLQVNYTSLPYSKIIAFSVETAGVMDLDSELDLFFSGGNKAHFEFSGQSSIMEIGQRIGQFIL